MFERIRSLFTRKESRAGNAIYMANRQASWMNRNFKAFADEGYTKNVVAYMAINKVAKAAAAAPFMLTRRNGEEITDHPLLSLLQRPNPVQSGAEFFQAVFGFYGIAGNAYLERTMLGRVPRELYTLRPDRMRVTPGRFGIPAGYEFKAGQESVKWEADELTGDSDIRHLKTFHPLDDWYGLSPIEAGAYAVDQHNESMKWMQALLQNGAAPSGVLEVKTEASLGDDEYNRLKNEIDEQFSGSRNAGRPMLLEGGMSWRQMGFNPDQMAAMESRYASARDVALALGVPPLLLNIPGDSTFNNYREARLALYEETVLPLLDMLCDELNAWLVPLFGDGLTLKHDIDAIPAIADKRREMWTMADNSQDLTVNERREIKGYEPVEGGESVMVPSNLIPLDFASAPIEPPAPQPEDDDEELTEADLKALAYGPDKRG